VKVFTWEEFQKADFEKPLAATVGVFDGLHHGHQLLIETVKKEHPFLLPCVITFQGES